MAGRSSVLDSLQCRSQVEELMTRAISGLEGRAFTIFLALGANTG